MATSAAMPKMIDDTNNNSRERLRRLSRHAIFRSQGRLRVCFIEGLFVWFLILVPSLSPEAREKEAGQKNVFSTCVLTFHQNNFHHQVLCIIKRMFVLLGCALFPLHL